MVKNKSGLSDIILTLIMILLVLVAVGIVWAVASGVINRGAGKVDLGTRCLDVDIKATSVVESWDTTSKSSSYMITLARSAGGDSIGGVKIALSGGNTTGQNFVYDLPGNMDLLATKRVNTSEIQLINSTIADVTVYFTDSSGNPQLCSTASTFKF